MAQLDLFLRDYADEQYVSQGCGSATGEAETDGQRTEGRDHSPSKMKDKGSKESQKKNPEQNKHETEVE